MVVPAGGDPHDSTCSLDWCVRATTGDALGKGAEVVLALVVAKIVSGVHVREGSIFVCTACLSNDPSPGPLWSEMPVMSPAGTTDSGVVITMHRLVGYLFVSSACVGV